jgi:hypothetical protein
MVAQALACEAWAKAQVARQSLQRRDVEHEEQYRSEAEEECERESKVLDMP